MYVKISNTLSARFYLKSKERLQKKFAKDIKIILIKKKKKRGDMVMSVKKILQESYRKKYYRMRKNSLS